MKIYSANVSGINNLSKMHTVINDARRYDISLLQETKLSAQNTGRVQLKWGHPRGVFMSSAIEGSRRGVLTLFSPRLNAEHLYVHRDDEGQFLLNVAVINDEICLIVNVYGDPTTDTNAARNIDRLAAQVEIIHNRFLVIHTIMGGDFNFALFDEDRRTTSRKVRAEAKFATMVSTY